MIWEKPLKSFTTFIVVERQYPQSWRDALMRFIFASSSSLLSVVYILLSYTQSFHYFT